ncbi:Uncharacterised protein [Enterobacter hormaechei]|nr:Uncharacterised protein [Enterobacter hormaechei]
MYLPIARRLNSLSSIPEKLLDENHNITINLSCSYEDIYASSGSKDLILVYMENGFTGGYGFAVRAGDNEVDVACVHDGVPALPSFQTVTVARCSATSRPV